MAGHGGGAWKVAYADFVTAMMAFFLVMWITAQSNAVKQSIAKYFEHPFDAASRSAVQSKSSSGASLVPVHGNLDGSVPHGNVRGKSPRGGGMLADDQPPADPANVPKSGGLRRRSGLMLQESDPSGIGTVVRFIDGTSGLDGTAKQALDELLPALHGKLNKIEIRGETACHEPTTLALDVSGGALDPWQLSYARCQAVMNYLKTNGIDAKRIRLSQAEAAESPAENEANRPLRGALVEVYLLPEYVDDFLGWHNQSTNRGAAITSQSVAMESSAKSPTEQKPSDEKGGTPNIESIKSSESAKTD
jgi:chemotaxis protein MotB